MVLLLCEVGWDGVVMGMIWKIRLVCLIVMVVLLGRVVLWSFCLLIFVLLVDLRLCIMVCLLF